jgi:hypothetical protein
MAIFIITPPTRRLESKIDMYKIIINVIVLLFFPQFIFGSTLDEVELFVIKNRSALPTSQQLKATDLSKVGIKINDRKDFQKTYDAYLAEYYKIYTDYKGYDAVKVFTAIKLRDYKENLASTYADAANPTYMAFALLTGAGIDYEKIGDRQHLHTLARSYGVTDVQIENGIWETLTMDWEEILGNAGNIISRVLSLQSVDKVTFMSNSMLPYLTLLCRGRTVPVDLENKIWDSFGSTFPNPNNSAEIITDYVNHFKEYVSGTPLESKYMMKVNQILKPYQFRLSMDINHCVIYSLFDIKIPVDTLGISDIVMQKRVGLSLLGFEMGQASYSDSTITLTSEYICDEMNDIKIVVSSDSLPKSFKPAADELWKNIGLNLTADHANTIYKNLLRKEFKNTDNADIIKMIIRDVSTHELKHKYDEIILSKKQRIAMDVEISSHLAETVCGGVPIYGLFLYINRMQYFYSSVDQVQIKQKLKPLIVEAWNLAINLENGKLTETDVVSTLKLRYTNYVTLTGYKLPALGVFEKALVKRSLKCIPDFKLE